MSDTAVSIESGQGILKNWYGEKSTSEALKKRRAKLAETRGIEDVSNKEVERGGADI